MVGRAGGVPSICRRTVLPATVLAALLLWLSLGGGRADAEVTTGASIDLYNSVLLSEGDALAAGLAVAELELAATDARDVRSRFVLRGTLYEQEGASGALVEVPRAEIRWRLFVGESYDLRVTAGRTRLSWGDGVVFNAGDVINGARPEELDLTAEVLRDETQWLTALYLPLGQFAFFEPVLLLPMYDPTIETTGDGDSTAADAGALAAWKTSGGGRIQFEILGIKTETGYLYRGAEELHAPYLSLQGNLFLDLYGGASLEITADRDSAEEDDLLLSAGALHTGNHPRLGGWTLRSEALWSERDRSLELYPEVTWSPSLLFSLFVRSRLLLLAEDRWADADSFESSSSLGLTWAPATGLTLSLFGTQVSGGAGGAPPVGLTTITVALGYVF